MKKRTLLASLYTLLLIGVATVLAQKEQLFSQKINVSIPSIREAKNIAYDYDIVYVRAPRAGDEIHKRFFADFSAPVTMEPGADLMLLHPDGKEELLVAGGEGSITDPFVSFDAHWVYFTHIYYLKNASQWNPPKQGADIFKIHLKSRKIVQLTNQQFSPNTGIAPWSTTFRSGEPGTSYIETGVYNMGACPLPGGKIAFTSNRDGFRPAKGYPAIALQLFVMDDRDTSIGETETPANLEKIGHFNLSGALHPVVLRDGRLMFSSLESEGARGDILWGIWTINPDGTNWAPLVSAFDPGGAPNGFHFQTQLSDGSVVVEEYYNQNNSGFGAYINVPVNHEEGYPAFGPAAMNDPKNPLWRYGRHYNAKPHWYQMPFKPLKSISMTPFTHGREGPADPSIVGQKESPAVGKFTHPSAAPGGTMLTCYSPGPVNHQYKHLPQIDGGIYLFPNKKVIEEPAELFLIKNDPNYNECWPRAVVPYKAVHGIAEPTKLPTLANDGTKSPHLPKGSPYALVGTSSFYKRETYPNGAVAEGKVTGSYAGKNDRWKGLDAFTSHGNGMPLNWHNQGSDAGLYENSDIHAVRILTMEPTTDRKGVVSGRQFFNHAQERLRVLGEIPLRKFVEGQQPLDPDQNPDTSFLAKIPADTPFTFQTLDRDGMVLNMSQTWHQLRPGEIRNDCGGCHAHSQKPTDFQLTLAAKPDYQPWDLTQKTPLLTSNRQPNEPQWDTDKSTGLRFAPHAEDVEYHRDIKPILARSCIACHNTGDGKEPAGNLNLDADAELVSVENRGKFPGTYYRLAQDERAKFGHKPPTYDSWGYPNASRYVRKFQSRRSLLTWKIYGKRLDGFSNDDHPSESKPGAGDLAIAGKPVDKEKFRSHYDIDFVGSIMPPPGAVQAGKVKPLSDEDRRRLVRWIDLGCPIDMDSHDRARDAKEYGWFGDDLRPTLSVTPPADTTAPLTEIVVGMFDYGTGIEPGSLAITADFAIDDIPPGTNFAKQLTGKTPDIMRYELKKPIADLPSGTISVSVQDKQGNITRVARTYRLGNVRK
ncbi:MAG: hypothetical protein R3B84_02620 [Zavarzinella sp.]